MKKARIHTRLAMVTKTLMKGIRGQPFSIVPMIVADIYRALEKCQRAKHFKGCNLLLQLWLVEHLQRGKYRQEIKRRDWDDHIAFHHPRRMNYMPNMFSHPEDVKGWVELFDNLTEDQSDVELPEGSKPPKFEMFDGIRDPRVHLRTYYDKLVGVGKDERIHMKLFMRSLKGDALSWYIIKDPKKWLNWVRMSSDFMDMFSFNTENALDVFYIQNLKKKPTKTFREYATRWRSKASKVRHALEEEQMNKFFVQAQDLQYYERLMIIESHKFSDIIKLGERIEEGIKSDMGGGIHMIEIEDDWNSEGSIWLITEGDDPKKPIVTLNPIIVQIQPSRDAEVNVSMPLEFEATSSTKTLAPIEVEFVSPANAPTPFEVAILPPKAHAPFGVRIATPIQMAMLTMTLFHTKAVPWDYTAEARRKGKVRFEETIAAQGMMRYDRVYTPEHLAESSKQATNRPPIIEIVPDDLWRKIQAKEYSVIDQLNTKISILALLQNSEAHKNSLLKVLSEAYVPSNITGGEMANMVGQVLESHKIAFHEDELPPEGLGHNKAL
ncbi:uncharacterized protein [Nicotiana sylvestris]|uniref:uncharacterized protein n=1 Tax=Nicotiana sylvestris TaxID=4096 RepID=UPI00388C8733